MFGMAAFVHQFQVRLMAAPDGHQHIRLVVFAEVTTEAALSVLNVFHVLISWGPVWEAAVIALPKHSSTPSYFV